MPSPVNQSCTGFTHKLSVYHNPKTNSFLCSPKSLKSFVMQLETNRGRCLLFLKGSVWESWSSDWISNVLKKSLCSVGALISNWAEYRRVRSQWDLFVFQLSFPLELQLPPQITEQCSEGCVAKATKSQSRTFNKSFVLSVFLLPWSPDGCVQVRGWGMKRVTF